MEPRRDLALRPTKTSLISFNMLTSGARWLRCAASSPYRSMVRSASSPAPILPLHVPEPRLARTAITAIGHASSRLLVLLAPLGLHAAFDFPLLTLQQNPDLGSTTRLLLGSASVVIGFSSIAFAIRLVRRVGRHHAPRTEIARERLAQLRRMWALLVLGSGAGFVGLIFVLTSIHHWVVNPERSVSLVVPIGLVSITIGIALLVVTSAIYIIGRNRMRGASQGFSSAPSRG